MEMKRDGISWGFCLIFFLAVLWMGCDSSDSTEGGNGSDEVVTVNKEAITRDQLLNELKLAKRKYRIQENDVLPPEQLILLKTNALNELIKQTMLLQEAQRQGITISQQEIMTQLERSREGYDNDSFQRSLEIEEISQAVWNKKQKSNLMIQKLTESVLNSEINISEKEILKYFNKNREEFQKGEQVRALHIMVETEDEARRILKMIRKGNSFSELAVDHSLGPEGKTGGDMGFFEAGLMPKGFDDIFKLKIGRVSDIIRTPFGYHIFKVMEKKPERNMSFEESQKKIHSILLRQAQEDVFQKWVETVKEKSEIVVNYDALETI